jgi:hypothetical protein
MSDQLVLWTAIFSAIATALAAIATWRAPIAAAKLAESLRRDAERADERHKQKLYVFSTLMQERAQIHSDNGVRALNLVDVAFSESREVREAWAELFSSFNLKPLPQQVLNERLFTLLGAIAKDIGLASDLRIDDLSRVYFPVVQEQDQIIKNIQRQQTLAKLLTDNVANASTPNPLWPPKPE